MRRMIVAVLAVALPLLALQGGAFAQSTSTFHSSGAFAEVTFVANGSFVDLFVARGCPTSVCSDPNIGTFINWFAFAVNPDGSFSFTEGDGVIPDSAFQSSTLQHMSLNVDTSQVPGFTTVTCTVAPGGISSCTNGPFGVMQADWQQTKASSSDVIEDIQTTQGPFVYQSHNDQIFDSAVASGNFLGTAFGPNSAQVGSNRNTTRNITRPH